MPLSTLDPQIVDLDPQIVDLDILRYNASVLLSRDINLSPGGLDVVMRELPEQLSRIFAATLRVPGQILQQNRLIHKHPATLWDHTKQRLGAHLPGLKRWLPVQYLEVRLTEHIVFPTISVPPLDAKMRVFVEPSFQTAYE